MSASKSKCPCCNSSVPKTRFRAAVDVFAKVLALVYVGCLVYSVAYYHGGLHAELRHTRDAICPGASLKQLPSGIRSRIQELTTSTKAAAAAKGVPVDGGPQQERAWWSYMREPLIIYIETEQTSGGLRITRTFERGT